MKKAIDLVRLMGALSLCLDFCSRGLDRHHQRVAFIGLTLAKELGLSAEEVNLLFVASIIHDSGVSTWRDKYKLEEFDVHNPWEHCRRGYELLSQVSFLKSAANIILCHHDRWAGSNPSRREGCEIPLAARIIHLCDRVDILLQPERHILEQRDEIVQQLDKLSGKIFDPELVAAFKDVSRRESFWLDLTSPFMLRRLQELPAVPVLFIDQQGLRELAELFAAVIDAKSPFTLRHSYRVSAVAGALAAELGFSPEEVSKIEIAGLLHDLGKLSVPDNILEKPGPLTHKEFSVMKQHPYYTCRILEEAGDLQPITEWASFHHEKLNGQGYPFCKKGPQLSLGARIIAVSDVFTALREVRPYRPAMKRPEIENILINQASTGALDTKVVEALLDNYERLEEVWARKPLVAVY
ncbi:HD-GYP domain-containing protein [Calderihabitans maritimus]|uniref:HD-GYP domain-containing protein n=1 Tax=Calderihabitans maritimus TaxID=1246530 RepID=A0A1Z5HXM0_9FIRM|nr:HD-GYP domain-containing protein [Calderihabitans maritimus]GAW94272.1 HD-GYP domain-containing protein [Calderihabitans maritimus]